MECRVIHAAINKKWILQLADSEKAPVDKDAVADGYKKATGKEIPKAAMDQYPDKKKEESLTATGKILGNKKAAPALATDSEPKAEAKDPAPDKPEKKNDKKKAK